MFALKARHGAASLVLLCLAAAAPAGQAPAPVEDYNDVVHTKDNNPISDVKVVSDNWDAVTVRGKGNVTISRAADEVVTVEYLTNKIPEYDQGLELRRGNKIKEAIAAFEKGLARIREADKPQRQYFQAGLADCYDAGNELDKFARIVDDMVGQKDPPRLVFETSQKLGMAYFRLREGAKAEAVFKRLVELCTKLEARAPGTGGLGKYIERYRLVADLWRIRSLEAQGKVEGIEGAERAYQIFPARAGAHPDLVAQAQIGELRCRAAKDPESAVRGLLALVPKLTDPKMSETTLPALYCAVADAYLAKAESPKMDELDCYWARWYYLKVVVQCPTDRASLARAYYGAGRCCEILAEKAREQRASDKAAKYFEVIDREFRDCPEYSLVKARAGK